MAEALVRIKDSGTPENPELEMEVKFSPAIDNNSPAHQVVAEIIKIANLKQVEAQAKVIAAQEQVTES